MRRFLLNKRFSHPHSHWTHGEKRCFLMSWECSRVSRSHWSSATIKNVRTLCERHTLSKASNVPTKRTMNRLYRVACLAFYSVKCLHEKLVLKTNCFSSDWYQANMRCESAFTSVFFSHHTSTTMRVSSSGLLCSVFRFRFSFFHRAMGHLWSLNTEKLNIVVFSWIKIF